MKLSNGSKMLGQETSQKSFSDNVLETGNDLLCYSLLAKPYAQNRLYFHLNFLILSKEAYCMLRTEGLSAKEPINFGHFKCNSDAILDKSLS